MSTEKADLGRCDYIIERVDHSIIAFPAYPYKFISAGLLTNSSTFSIK